jgi:L-arabinose isomerase
MSGQHNLKVGLFGIGLQAYRDQFNGLEARLTGSVKLVESKLKGYGSPVANHGLVDKPDKAMDAGHQFRQADVDLIFRYVTTFASSTILPVIRRTKVPVIVLNLAPDEAI